MARLVGEANNAAAAQVAHLKATVTAPRGQEDNGMGEYDSIETPMMAMKMF